MYVDSQKLLRFGCFEVALRYVPKVVWGMEHIPLENRDSDLLSQREAKGQPNSLLQLLKKVKNNKVELFVAEPGTVTKGSTHRLAREAQVAQQDKNCL